MTEIINISQYKQQIETLKKEIITEFDKIIQQIEYYEIGLEENEGMFEQMKDEEDEIASKRGEGIIDKFIENIKQTEKIIQQENKIKNIMKEIETKYLELIKHCKENKIKIIKENNEIINKVIGIKKELQKMNLNQNHM